MLALGEERSVDQVEIDIIRLQLLQTGPQRVGDVSDVAEDFGDDEQLVSDNAGFLDGGSQLGFGLIHFGPVEVVVAQLDGSLGRVDAVLVELGLRFDGFDQEVFGLWIVEPN